MINDNTLDSLLQWYSRKAHSLILAACLNRRSDEYLAVGYADYVDYKRRSLRVYQCSKEIEAVTYADGTLKHKSRNFCDDRLCPQCARMRSLRLARNAMEVSKAYYSAHPDAPKALHVILTQRNCAPCELRSELGRMIDALRKITNSRRDTKNRWAGMARSIEITYNEHEGSFHPHVHLIVLPTIDDAELKSDSWWSNVWMECMKLDYLPMCKVVPCYSDGALAEVSKYITKMSKIYDIADRDERYAVVSCIDDAIKKHRVIAYYGEWKQLRAELQQNDIMMLDNEFEGREIVSRQILQWAGLEKGYVPVGGAAK